MRGLLLWGRGLVLWKENTMRRLETGSVLKVHAIAGLHVVVLAWDFIQELAPLRNTLPPELTSLLGFAIERRELDKHGAVVENYTLRGIKRFQFKDEGLE